ncbi:MAG: DUF2971 domain-containing protein [Rhodospirillaceae bacterium]|nr:DUF2971 domain-containing protein [Rhodospirillaceae bacterium]
MMGLYRLRRTKHLVGKYKELDKQEIYFAHPTELNDPMEGFRDIYWLGDRIVWQNLFRHYIYCLHITCVISRITGDTGKVKPEHIPITSDVPENWTQEAVDLFDDICTRVFERAKLLQFTLRIGNAKRKVRRDELLFYLYSFHHVALHEIESAYFDHGLASNRPLPLDHTSNFENSHKLQEVLGAIEEEDAHYEQVFKVSSFMTEQISLRYRMSPDSSRPDNITANRQFIVLDFPKKYMERLETIMYPNWYVACFLRSYSNSSTWGNYGDGHKGVCLIFKTDHEDERITVPLEQITGNSNQGEEWRCRPMEVHEVTYGEVHDEIDFFRSLGQLPESKSLDVWYKDATGSISDCASHIVEDMEAWREGYWQSFYPGINKKTEHWKYEQESRLILCSMLGELPDKRQRKLKYKFESLRGIIFGMRTSDRDKVRMLDVLKKKCRENDRTEFQVFQAYYDHKTGNIGKYPVNIDLSE